MHFHYSYLFFSILMAYNFVIFYLIYYWVMRVSLIITTYNWPESLILVLKSIEKRTVFRSGVLCFFHELNCSQSIPISKIIHKWFWPSPSVPVHSEQIFGYGIGGGYRSGAGECFMYFSRYNYWEIQHFWIVIFSSWDDLYYAYLLYTNDIG